ncbi:MgtC/SapB family protein [Salipaludibacillus daqingensis]|uniref:MgtC/SapB family protein n=1 Tax=Salipaludibacillus daqingensis TaxID=3041001 RepID=UPI00247690D7|nr:MgtC/SapB family protein [Salipaludibacillus daqingensis]
METLEVLYIYHISPYIEMVFKVVFSAFLGFMIGWDRSSKSKPAGIKTHMYVCISCCLITLISIYSVEAFSTSSNNVMMDPMRLAAQLVSGLGFLGAGVILKDGLNVKGLTSAAMMLFVGGVGIGVAAGFYVLVISTVLVAISLARLGNFIEDKSLLKDEVKKSKAS